MTTQNETFQAAGALTISDAESLRQALLARLGGEEREPALDFSRVEAVDLAIIQVLFAAAHSAARAGKRLRLTGLSAPLQERIARCGLDAAELMN